ncbi:MAG: flagellar motor switch protein FliM [Deltaproteobacteria bacterium]|nr:flagellar motor switch protein FliM [Deltaproteobacteria bacterium]
MEPILKKEEIAQLLSAVTDGRIPVNTHENVDKENDREFTPIDIFNLPQAEIKQFRIPNLDIILDIFCRTYSTSLTHRLQRTSSVTRTSLSSCEFKDFFHYQSNLGATGIIDMSPLQHGSLIILDPELSFSLVEVMLGASTELDPIQPDRKLTAIELIVLKTLFVDGCNDISKAFSQLLDMKAKIVKLENNSRLLSIVEPAAEVIVATFGVKIGDLTGEMYLVIPFATLEPLRDLLKDLLNISSVNKSSWQSVLEDEVLEMAASITAQSGTINLSISQLLQLKNGDLLDLDYDPDRPLTVFVENQPAFFAVPGTHNGKKAINLTGMFK